MTESQTCRMYAMAIIRRYAPLEYAVCLEREREVDRIARNAQNVEPILVGKCCAEEDRSWLMEAA